MCSGRQLPLSVLKQKGKQPQSIHRDKPTKWTGISCSDRCRLLDIEEDLFRIATAGTPATKRVWRKDCARRDGARLWMPSNLPPDCSRPADKRRRCALPRAVVPCQGILRAVKPANRTLRGQSPPLRRLHRAKREGRACTCHYPRGTRTKVCVCAIANFKICFDSTGARLGLV